MNEQLIIKCPKCGSTKFTVTTTEIAEGEIEKDGELYIGKDEVDSVEYECSNCKEGYTSIDFKEVRWRSW